MKVTESDSVTDQCTWLPAELEQMDGPQARPHATTPLFVFTKKALDLAKYGGGASILETLRLVTQ